MKRRQFIKQSGALAAGAALPHVVSIGESEKKRIPKSLKSGDTIAVTAPAGAVFSPHYIDAFEQKLKGFGFKVVKGKSLSAQEGYLAGCDQCRADEINDFFKDQSVHAIFTMRGGWGCSRILDLLDYEAILKNPKIVMGYSDITALIIAIQQKTGLVTFHGPMGYSSWKDFSSGQVYQTLVSGKKMKMTNPPEEQSQLKTLIPGKARGALIGGNLTVVSSLIGTTYEPNWNNKILCLEETGEEPYRIDRMLWQMKLAGVYDKINGVVLGSFKKCNPEEPEKSFSLQEVFDQHANMLNKPMYSGASFGHTINKFTLPIGIEASLDANNHTIELLENPTRFNG